MLTEQMIKQWMIEDGSGILYDSHNPWIFTGYITAGPERLALMLENNKRNRKFNERNVSNLKETMSAGLWNENVAKINFTKDRMLDDGQHRLRAALEAGVTIRVMVTWGVEKETQHFTDRRGSRTLANDLEIDGYKNSLKLAAITRIVYLRDVKNYTIKMLLNKGFNTGVPDAMLYEFFKSHSEEIIAYSKTVSNIYMSVRGLEINRDVINILGVEFSRINDEDAQNFWKSLRDGVYEDDDDPVKRLRERLVKNGLSKTNKIPKNIMAALIIKAWNFYEQGESIKQLKYSSGGANPEAFPEIVNPYSEYGNSFTKTSGGNNAVH